MTIIFKFRDTDKTRTFDSEMSTKVEKKQPNTPCIQALKQAKSFFNVSVSLSKFWFIDLLRTFDSRTSTSFWKKSFFQVFACLGACEKGTFGFLCLKFVNISESKVFIISRSRNQKMLTDILKRTFFSVCLLGCQGSFGCLFSTFVDISESNFLNISISQKSKIVTDLLKKVFQLFPCLSGREQSVFGSLCSTFFVISESNVLNISVSWNSKMLTDMLEQRRHYRRFPNGTFDDISKDTFEYMHELHADTGCVQPHSALRV